MNVREMPHIPQSLTLMASRQSFLFMNLELQTARHRYSSSLSLLPGYLMNGLGKYQVYQVKLVYQVSSDKNALIWPIEFLLFKRCLLAMFVSWLKKQDWTENKQQMILRFPEIPFVSKRNDTAAQSKLSCFVLCQLQILALFFRNIFCSGFI